MSPFPASVPNVLYAAGKEKISDCTRPLAYDCSHPVENLSRTFDE